MHLKSHFACRVKEILSTFYTLSVILGQNSLEKMVAKIYYVTASLMKIGVTKALLKSVRVSLSVY